MKELAHLRGDFTADNGWTLDAAYGLVNQMLLFLQTYKGQLQMYYCTIDLDARRKLIAEGYTIPHPVEMCNEYCAETVIKSHIQKTYRQNPKAEEADEMVFVFDQGEDFYGPFQQKWKREKRRFYGKGGFSIWNVITDVTATTRMKQLPGLQAADMLAWAVNREHTVDEGAPGRMHAYIMRQIISQYYVSFDEAKLRERYVRVKLR